MKKAYPQAQITPFPTDHLLLHPKELSKFLYKAKGRERIKIVYWGTPRFSAYILEKLIEFCQNPPQRQFTVQTVVTRPDKPVGRKQSLTSSPVSMVAKKYGIPTLKPTKLDNEFLNHHSSLLSFDLFIVASYGKIIPQALLNIPNLGSLNVHPSLLPNYRGPSPIITPILNGDKKTGVTIMLMDEQMDHGPILTTKEISISEEDTNITLSNKLSQASTLLLIDTMVKFVEGKIKPNPQNHKLATFTKIIKKEDGYIDINNPPSAQILDRMIRAYYPWPGVWTRFRQGSSGQAKIVKFLPGNKLQMEGKKSLAVKDFLNGYPDFPLKNLNL